MTLVIAVTVFSVLLSAYAVAIRMIKMPAVQTRAADGTKLPRAVKRKWWTKKHFGFSAGLAVRSAFRKKMRFFITLLAAVVSATLVITIASLIYAVDKSDKNIYDPDEADFEVHITSDFTDESNISKDFKKIRDSGLFRKTLLRPLTVYCREEKDGSWDKSFIGEKMNKGFSIIRVSAVTPETFEQLETDMTYDELVEKGGVLVCSKMYDFADVGFERADIDTLKRGTEKITVPIGEGKELTLDISGGYTVKTLDNGAELYSDKGSIAAVVPLENFYDMFSWLKTNPEGEVTGYSGLSVYFSLNSLNINLVAQDGRQEEAEQFLRDAFGSRIDINSNVATKQTQERAAKALRIAGLSLAAIVFAVAMINIASTSATEMVNRRRELSMLRACGMSMRQIFKTLRIEVLFYSAVSAGISAVLGTGIASVIYRLIDEEAKMATLPFTAVIAVFLLMTAVMMCAYLLPLHNMSRSQIAQDIRMKE